MNEEAEALTQRRTPYSLACEILELRRKRDARDDKILTQRMELARLEQMREELVAERDALAAHLEEVKTAAERYLRHGPGCVTLGNGIITPVADVFRDVLARSPATSLDRQTALLRELRELVDDDPGVREHLGYDLCCRLGGLAE